MDPDATLQEMREAYATEDWERCAELANALDMWLSRGGFMPADWLSKH